MTDIIVKDIKNGSEYYYGGSAEVSAEDVSYDNTTSGAVADNIQDAIDEVFQSVSNGKTLIAAAITDKGVSTAATDSFQTMASNISSLDIATEAQKTAYGLAHGKDILLFSTALYTDQSSDGENLLLYNCVGFEDKEYYIIGKKHSYSSSEEYSFDIYEFYKNGTYNKTDINFDIEKSDGNPPYIQWENRYKISGNEQYRYFVYAKGYSYDHPPYGTYLRFDTQTGVLEKYTTEIPYNDAVIANERITLPYAIAYTTIDTSSGKVVNIVARI